MAFSPLDLLQRPPKMMAILVYLLKNEETTVSHLIKDLGLATKTYYTAIRRLIDLGFAYEHEKRTFPRQVFIGLTLKGKELAGSLQPIAEILENTLVGLKSELEAIGAKARTEEESVRMLEILVLLMDLEFTAGEWDDAESQARRALDIASALGDKANMAKALRLTGEIHHRKGLDAKAKEEVRESLKIHMKINDLGGASEDRYVLGNIKEKGGDLKGALREFEASVELAKSSEDEVLQARANLGIGRILAKKGRYGDSLIKFKESIETFERLDEVDELPRAYTSAGASAFYLDVDESLKWHEKCIEVSRKVGDVIMFGYGLSNAAGCHNKKKETKKALQYLEKAWEIFEGLGQKDMMVGVNIQIGWAHGQEEKWSLSERHFFQAINLARKHDLEYELGDALLNCGLMSIDRGRSQEAKRQMKEALEIFERLDNHSKVNRVREALGQISQ